MHVDFDFFKCTKTRVYLVVCLFCFSIFELLTEITKFNDFIAHKKKLLQVIAHPNNSLPKVYALNFHELSCQHDNKFRNSLIVQT